MEIQTLLIGVTCCILSAVIIYLISIFSMSEKTFEEVMEEQRLRHEEEEKKARSEKKAEKGERKKYKKFKEKNREKAQQSKGTEIVGTSVPVKTAKKTVRIEEPAVSEASPAPKIIEPKSQKSEKNQLKVVPLVANHSVGAPSLSQTQAKVASPQRKQTGNNKSPKPVSSAPQNSALKTVPKPDNANRKSEVKSPKVEINTHKAVELENTYKKVAGTEKEIKTFVTAKDTESKSEIKKINISTTQKCFEKNTSPVESKNIKKKSNKSVDSQPIAKKTNDTGLEKKATNGECVSVSPKEFEEKIRKVNYEKEKIEQELSKIKLQSSKDAKQHEEECKKLHIQNEKLQEQKGKIEVNLNRQIDQLLNQIKNSKVKYQKIIEENNALKSSPPKTVVVEDKKLEQKVHILEEELGKNLRRLEVSEKFKAKSEVKIKELEAEKNKNESSAKKLKEFQLSNKNLQNDKSRLTVENGQLNEALNQAQKQCAAVNIQLQNLYQEIKNKDADNNEKLKAVEKELLLAKKENKVLLETNKHLNNPLTIEASLERQDTTSAPNGTVQEEKFTCTKISLIEHERILGEKNSEIMQLTSELSTQETESTARVEEKDNEITALTCKLNNNIKEVEELKKEIKVWHAKNDDLRKKNWKAMEALNDSEKSTEKQIVDAVHTAEMQAADTCSYDRTLLQSIFPSITVDKSLEHRIWMKTFEEKAVEFLKSNADEPVSNLKEMTKNVELFEKKLDVAMKESTELAAQLKSEKDLQIKISDKLKESETKFIELQSTYEIKLSELSNELAIQTKKYSDLEKTYEDLHPNSQHNEVENNELKEHVNSLNMRLTEASEDKMKLEDKLKYHENLFLITDEKLQLLQKSVEEEEKKWKLALAEAEKEIQILKEKQTSLESHVSEQEALIEKAEDKKKDLAETIAKLNGILKTGQDALSQEQKLVENLQQKF